MTWQPISEAPVTKLVLGGWYRDQGRGKWTMAVCAFDESGGCWWGGRGGSPTHYLAELPAPPERPATAVPGPAVAPSPTDTVNWEGDVINAPVPVQEGS